MNDKVILIIEDEPTINRIISKYFRNAGYKVLSALNGKVGVDLFHSNQIDLVCLDIMIPELNGWEVASIIRDTSHTPIILMSALSEEEDILKGFSLQVDDYITKPFSPSVLLAKVKSLFERIEIEREFNNVNGVYSMDYVDVEMSAYEESEMLKQLLSKDELTGISNRRFLNFHIANLIKESRDFHSSFGVLFIDIDFFKKVNDIYGHNAGDIVLKDLSQIIKKSIRNDDVIGRWGGEEFLAVIKVDDIGKLEIIADKLRKIVESHAFKLDVTSIKITVSIGGTMYKNDESKESVIERADHNMYVSKSTGRNKVTIK